MQVAAMLAPRCGGVTGQEAWQQPTVSWEDADWPGEVLAWPRCTSLPERPTVHITNTICVWAAVCAQYPLSASLAADPPGSFKLA